MDLLHGRGALVDRFLHQIFDLFQAAYESLLCEGPLIRTKDWFSSTGSPARSAIQKSLSSTIPSWYVEWWSPARLSMRDQRLALPSKILLGAVGVLGAWSLGSAAEPEQTTGFTAIVSARHAYVRSEPSDDSPILGTVEAGAQVQVTRCVPDCDAKGAWALLADGGAIRRALLETSGSEYAGIPPSEQQYRYATVLARGAKAYARPDVRAQVVEDLPPHRVIALAPEQPEAARGWMQRVAGSYVRAAEVRLARPSALQGEFSPKLPLAFVVQKVPRSATAAELPKYRRFAILEERQHDIRTAEGRIDRRYIRIARRRLPPSGLPARAKWVHLDLSEQTLVAYEGQRPVFATVVSTGVRGKRTLTGLHRVWLKTAHDRMHGEGYDLEEVPYTLYFKDGQALHGAFWHDRFGHAITHGCINLSMADARWLFRWAPPPLPTWWHSIVPQSGAQALWVLVEDVRTSTAGDAARQGQNEDGFR